MRRRDFLAGAASSLAAASLLDLTPAAQETASAWQAGDVQHVLPTVNHQRFLIKASFKTAPIQTPALLVGGRKVPGRPGDSRGFFWAFDAPGLEPGRQYELQLIDARGRELCGR